VRFYFDWIVDHRFTDFLAAKRDLFLYPPDATTVERFRAAIRALVDRIAADREAFAADPQRQFLLSRLSEELGPLLAILPADDLAARVAEVETRMIEVQDLARAYTKT